MFIYHFWPPFLTFFDLQVKVKPDNGFVNMFIGKLVSMRGGYLKHKGNRETKPKNKNNAVAKASVYKDALVATIQAPLFTAGWLTTLTH